jgi:polyisoprenoid-binding protein YceI
MSIATQPFTGTFTVDPVHSTFAFTVTHMRVSTFRASFDDVTAQVVADEHGIRLEGSVRVDSVSIRTPAEFRQHVVYGSDFFDADNHPQITFRSTDVRLDEDGTAVVTAELTIKGMTKPVTLTGTYQPPTADPFGGTRAGIDLSATVDRRDWDLSWQAPLPGGGIALGTDVKLSAQIELVKQA